ncbi:MAG: cytochrome d ubiquinol oxidase subunit II [Bifidobacteriaceae bacterium]|jgi:cytochrome d ubiquinol oxidase subunit II|nr:cytochrome d ubiquinol oxidase subunit II [Bifidobacteriaceae bacterium]
MLTSILALAPAAEVDPAGTEATANALVSLLHRLVTAPTGLELLWFSLIAVLWTGYLVLEGFDFGVGMLLPIIGKKDSERRAMLSTIGPLWDGNEVWVLTAGGATFAAFPEWYATLFSAAYLPLFLILVGLIIRAVAFEYRGKINGDGWRKLWDWCIILGSWIPAILWGVAFANLVAGVKAAVDPTQLGPSKIVYNGTFFDLVFAHQGFLLLGGLTTAALFMAHGAIFLSLKTDGEVRQRSESLAPKLSIVATVIAAVWVVWLGLKFAGGNHPTALVWIAIAVAALGLIVVVLTTLARKFGLAFTSMTVALLAAVVTIFATLFPNVINGSNVALKGDAISDPIVGRIVLGTDNDGAGLNVNDVVALTFAEVEKTAAADLQADPSPYTAETLTPLIVTDLLSEDVQSGARTAIVTSEYWPAGLLPVADVKLVVDKTFERVAGAVGDGSLNPADVQGAPGEAATALTAKVLADSLAGTFPAAGAIDQEQVQLVVTAAFARVGAALQSGALTYADVQAEAGEEAKALTAAVLADVPGIANGSLTVAAGVIPAGDVITTVKITLARNGLPADDATVGAVVADIVSGSSTIGGLPAATVVAEVEKTVQAAIDQLPTTVEGVLGAVAGSVQAVLGDVVVVLQSVADDPKTPKFVDGMDLTKIANGEAWPNDSGLANLNGRVQNANGALAALHALGMVTDKDDAVVPLAAFVPLEEWADDGSAVITGQPIHAAASSEKTLQLMTIVAICLVPIVLAYQAWSIWVFRRRISAERIPAESGLDPAKI